MQRRFFSVLAIALSIGLAAYGQSLGDVARANREKQPQANPSAKQPVVVTNDDLGKDPEGNAPPQGPATPGNKASHPRSGEQHPIDQAAAAQWKKQILAQKEKIATLQAGIDQLNAAIHPAGSAQFDGPTNRLQAQQAQRLAEVQLQLDEQKRKLAEMQDEARRAGMHTAVYDP